MSKRKDTALYISNRVAVEMGMPVGDVLKMVETQSLLLRRVMEDGKFEGVMFPYLGKFVVLAYRLKAINNPSIRKILK